jgi:hypothetical protein
LFNLAALKRFTLRSVEAFFAGRDSEIFVLSLLTKSGAAVNKSSVDINAPMPALLSRLALDEAHAGSPPNE